MKKVYLFLVITAITLAACKSGGKKSMKGDETVDATDFISFFDEMALPLTLSDSVFLKKPGDSTLIESAVYNQFIPDSIFKTFGKNKLKFHAIGKFRNQEEETYLIFRAVATGKQQVYVAAFNKENKFSAAMPAISMAGKAGTEKISVDKKFTFTHTTYSKAPDGSSGTVNEVYAYNTAGFFMMILTDGVPAGTDLPIIDPNDTLTRKSRYAGNYAKDKRNLLSIRDGVTTQQLRFFIHIETKQDRFCDGEIKGEAIMIGPDSASYTGNGDPCILGFKFKANSIRITETNCGNHRGLECSFDGTFSRQKVASKPKERKPVVKKTK